ncbi:MAG: restriction endonuclease subunit S [Terriglobia bacterium]
MSAFKPLATTGADLDPPEGWALARLNLIGNVRLGKTPRRSHYKNEGIHRIVKFRDIKNWMVDYSESEAAYVVDSPQALKGLRCLQIGDVLLTASAHSGDQIGRKCAYVDRLPDAGKEVFFVGELLGVSVNRSLAESKWPFFWFLSEDGFEAVQAAVAGVHLTSGRAQNIWILLAPLAEQRRIVQKAEQLLANVSGARERLSRVPAILKRFRQAVLAAAFSGRLTADWREQAGTTESTNSFVKEILHEREAEWERGHYRPPASFEEVELPDLPEDWCWHSFDTFVTDSFYGPRFAEDEYSDKGIPTIRTTDIDFDGSILLKDPPRIALSQEKVDKFGLLDGDLLVTRTGATIGKCAIYDERIGPAIPGAYLIRFRLTRHSVPPRFLLLFLMSPQGQKLLLGRSTAVAQPNVNATSISRFPVPLPPRQEIDEIVRRVNALLKLADDIEIRVAAGSARAEKLTQAILAKAFRGELVPTEAELARREGRPYESASDLLRRIREERESKLADKTKLNASHKAGNISQKTKPQEVRHARSQTAQR